MGEHITASIPEAIESSTQDTQLFYIGKESFDDVIQSDALLEDKAALFAQMARVNALYMVARAGSGHLGSSFSSLDIVSWLYLNVLKPGDRYFSSKGHDVPGLYSVQAALGIIHFDKIHELRRLRGLPGHPDVNTPGTHTNTGSLGMGVSKAKGFLYADDLLGKSKGKIIVMTGDGELQEGQFWESLIGGSRLRCGRLTVIIDHNKIQSDTYVAHVSDLGDLEDKFRAFGWEVCRCNGHNYTELRQTLEHRCPEGKPLAIIADTIKGRGVSFMEHTAMAPNQLYYSYHSGALSPEDYQKATEELSESIRMLSAQCKIKAPSIIKVNYKPLSLLKESERMIPVYTEAILEEADLNPNLVALDADLILDTGLIAFKEKYPDRFIDCGIAEQDMVSQAGTMALTGLLPVVHSFACFLTARASEQIYNNSTEKKKIIYVGSLAGLLPGGPGHSHQSVRDITAMSAMPGITIMEPVNSRQVKAALRWAVRVNPESTYLRLTSIPYDNRQLQEIGEDVVEGKGEVIFGNSNKVVIISVGPIMTNIAMSVADTLSLSGVSVQVICTVWLNIIDIEWYRERLRGTKFIVTLENHFVERGFGSWFIGKLAAANIDSACRSEVIGVDELPACGAAGEILDYHGLSSESILERVIELCNKFSVQIK